MSKKEQTTTHTDKPTPFWKKASFPWAIIIGAALFLAGNINGFNLREDQQNRITREASALVSQLKSDQK
jgi:hypothetical protein